MSTFCIGVNSMCTCGMNNVCDKLLCLGVICQDMLISFALMLVSIDSVEDGQLPGLKIEAKAEVFFSCCCFF